MNPPLSFLNNLRLKLMSDIFFVFELVDFEVVVDKDLFVNIYKWKVVVTKTRDPGRNSVGKLGGGLGGEIQCALHTFVGVDESDRSKGIALGHSLGGLSSEQL